MDEKNNQNQKIQTLHTFSSDMADAVREQEATVIKIALAEKAKKEKMEESYLDKKASSNNIYYVIGGIVLVALSIWGIFFLIQKGKEASSIEPTQNIAVDTLIHSDEQVLLDVTNITTKNDFIDLIKKEKEKDMKQGNVKSIILYTVSNGAKKQITTQNLFNLMRLSSPGLLTRSFEPGFMMGLYKNDSKSNLFIILQTKDYNQTFSGMLEWEPTLLLDMFSMFDIDVSSSTQSVFETPWSDKIISNKDARVLRLMNGQELLTYMFADKNRLIISDKQEVSVEVLSRLVTQNLKPL